MFNKQRLICRRAENRELVWLGTWQLWNRISSNIKSNLWKSYQNVGRSFNFCYVERDVRFIDTQDIAYVLENTIFCASEIDTITYTYSQTQKRVHVYSLMIASACIENHCWYQRNERKSGIGYLYKIRTIYRMLCWPLV